MINITFWQMEKRQNSTLQPSTAGTLLACELKDDCSILSPVLQIKNFPTNINPLWNYCHIPHFSKYYFITDWTWKNGLWEISCIEDVLATFRTTIGNLSEYVLRSSYEMDGSVIDTQYPTTAQTDVYSRVITSDFPLQKTWLGGYWVIGIISKSGTAAQGAITYYQMTAAQMARLKAYMMSDDFIANAGLDLPTVTGIVPAELLKTMYNPFQYIVSCTWIPLPASYIPSSFKTLETISFGWWTPPAPESGDPIQGYRINSNGYTTTQSYSLELRYHPQSSARGMFTNHSPYTDRMLYYPCFGSIPLNDDSINAGDRIRLDLSIDGIFGDALLEVVHTRLSGSDYLSVGLLSRQHANLGIPIQLAQNSVDVFQTGNVLATNAISGVMTAFSKNTRGLTSTIDKAAGIWQTVLDLPSVAESSIADAIQNPVGQLQTSGQSGSMAALQCWPYLVEKFRLIADDDNAQKGRPLCKVRQLSTIPGYIMVDTPDVPINCTAQERQQIASFLSNGFFYE